MSKNILGIFDGSDIDGITALIDKLEKSSFDYLNLEGDGVKIVIGKNGVMEVSGVCAPAAPAAAAPVTAAAVQPAEKPAENAAPASPAEAAPVKPAVTEQAGVFIVKSPSYGIFYAQSEPGAPAYVKVGDTVQVGDTLGLVEIMKTFNAVSAEVAGEVVGIHVQNQEVLEPDQPLFSIKVK
jgi:acetyl-CoA carboxylase biotin carboxyl carrier protein